MPEVTFKEYVLSFKSIQGALAGLGVALAFVPSIISSEPPFLPAAGFITSAVAGATIVVAYFYAPHPSRRRKRFPPLVRSAIKAFVAAVLFALLYFVVLTMTTVRGPGADASDYRYQTGFGKLDWSLTDEGRKVKIASPSASKFDWMADDALFYEHGPEVIWASWSINTAGVVLIALFMLAFALWTFGWSLLAKQHAMDLCATPGRVGA